MCGVSDHPAQPQCPLIQFTRVLPCLQIRFEALERAIVGVERQPYIGHLDHIRRVAGGDHGREFFEGRTPGQGSDFDPYVGVGVLESLDDALEGFGALGACDHLDQLQGRGCLSGERQTYPEYGGGKPQCRPHERGRFKLARMAALRSSHSASTPSKPICNRTTRSGTPKSTAEFGPAACTRVTSAGITRLSCPPQLTPILKIRS